MTRRMMAAILALCSPSPAGAVDGAPVADAGYSFHCREQNKDFFARFNDENGSWLREKLNRGLAGCNLRDSRLLLDAILQRLRRQPAPKEVALELAALEQFDRSYYGPPINGQEREQLAHRLTEVPALLGSRSIGVRRKAAKLLEDFRDDAPECQGQLIAALEGADASLIRQISRTLREQGWGPTELAAEAFSMFLRDDPSQSPEARLAARPVKLAAAEALGAIGPPASKYAELLLPLLRDADPEAVLVGINALGRIGVDWAPEAVAELLLSERRSSRDKLYGLEYIGNSMGSARTPRGQTGGEEARGRIQERVRRLAETDPDEAVRQRAAEVLRRL